MHIKASQIHPSLRFTGVVTRALSPRLGVHTMRLMVRIQSVFKMGRARSRKIAYRQETISRADGSKLRLCIYSPKQPKAGCAGVLWLHGGGYAIGFPEQDETRYFVPMIQASDCIVVSPDYTRSIDAPYPAAADDCYLALLWLKENADRLGVDDARLFVGGNSAGGGLAVSTCLRARDLGEVSVAFCMPLYPMLDDRMQTPSSQNNDAPVWNSRSNEAAWRLYLDQADTVEKYAAPARETDFSGFPPTLTFVGDIEPFYDETCAFIDKLHHAGVDTRFRVFENCFHAFDVTCPKSVVAKESDRFLLDGFLFANEYLRKTQPKKKGVQAP